MIPKTDLRIETMRGTGPVTSRVTVGQKFDTKYGVCVVEDILSGVYCVIRFLKTGSQSKVQISNLIKLQVKDSFLPIIYGEGYLGKCSSNSNLYNTWHSMLRRCYDKEYRKYKDYGGKGVTVCDRWKCFCNFLEDCPKIKGWEKKLGNWKEYSLDKDKSQKMVYSKETCEWLSKEEQSNFTIMQKSFIAVSPTGDIFRHDSHSIFSREHRLERTKVSACLRGERKSHKGWVFAYE